MEEREREKKNWGGYNNSEESSRIRGVGRFESAGWVRKSDAEAAVDHGGVAMDADADAAATGSINVG